MVTINVKEQPTQDNNKPSSCKETLDRLLSNIEDMKKQIVDLTYHQQLAGNALRLLEQQLAEKLAIIGKPVVHRNTIYHCVNTPDGKRVRCEPCLQAKDIVSFRVEKDDGDIDFPE